MTVDRLYWDTPGFKSQLWFLPTVCPEARLSAALSPGRCMESHSRCCANIAGVVKAIGAAPCPQAGHTGPC